MSFDPRSITVVFLVLFATIGRNYAHIRPQDCRRHRMGYPEIQGNPYMLVQPASSGVPVNIPYLCDLQEDGGGWVVIQRRSFGDVSFNRNWTEYKGKFGSFRTDFWLGLKAMHNLSKNGYNELRVSLVVYGEVVFADYDNFRVANETQNYRLLLGKFVRGNATNVLFNNNGRMFTTYDRDNDGLTYGNCAHYFTGGWWFASCGGVNLNGLWAESGQKRVWWGGRYSRGTLISLVEMKVRVRNKNG